MTKLSLVNALPLAALLLLHTGADAAQNALADSQNISRPGGTPYFPATRAGAIGRDSTFTATVTNLTVNTATISRPEISCPAGYEWGHNYGVGTCLRPIDRCDAAYLNWSDGDAACQGFAPARAAFFYVPKYTYQGNSVSTCPPGSSRTTCIENHISEDSPPITVMTVSGTSNSVGSASAVCRNGAWAISTSSCTLNDGTGNPPPTDTSCAAKAISWSSGGYSCSGMLVGTTNGGTALAYDATSPYVGTASATCSAGTWSTVFNTSCAPPPPGTPPGCPSQNISWTEGIYTCTASVPSNGHGGSAYMSDTTAPHTGVASTTCSNGSWTAPYDKRCGPTSCPGVGAIAEWAVGSAVCSAYVPATPFAIGNHTYTSTNGKTGTYTAQCRTDGTWSEVSKTCSVTCPSNGAYASWTVGSNTCGGTLPANPVPPGSYSVSNTVAGLGGQYNATCSSSGTWNFVSSTCAPKCAGGTLNWTLGSSTCTGTVAATNPGTNVAITDSVAPITGTYNARCNVNGVWEENGPFTCSAPPCAGGSLSWTVGSATCTGSVATTNPGSTYTVVDSTAPTTGSYPARCNTSGVWEQYGAFTCTATYPCTGGTLSWTVGANTCTGYAATTQPGSTYTIYDSTGPATGSYTARCNSYGSWEQYGGFSCSAPPPPPPGCSSLSGSWGAGCTGTAPGVAHGQTSTAYDYFAPYKGSFTVTCNSGAWSYVTSSCN